ncbi:MAG: hypothetical protein ACRDVD_05865, partial [Acidimicrobiia bacterium]
MARISSVLLLALGLLSATPVPLAIAAFPGVNGKIAFTTFRDGNFETYEMDAVGTGSTNLTTNSARDTD